MKQKYYEELYLRWFAWKRQAGLLDSVFSSYAEYEACNENYTSRTKDLCSWLKILNAADAEEWEADKKTYHYIFAIDDAFLAFLENFMTKEKIGQIDVR